MLHIDRCALARQTFWCHSHVCVSIQSKVIDKKAEIRRNVPLERSSEVTRVVFANNFWLDIDTDTGLYHWVCFVKAHRLICNMTYMNRHMTLTWDDLRSNFEIDLSRSSSICFEPPRRTKHIDVKIMVLALILKELFTNNFSHKMLFWPLMTSRTLNTDLSSKPIEKSVARRMSFQMLFAILF